jgi:hypothetical protein
MKNLLNLNVHIYKRSVFYIFYISCVRVSISISYRGIHIGVRSSYTNRVHVLKLEKIVASTQWYVNKLLSIKRRHVDQSDSQGPTNLIWTPPLSF